MKTSILRVAASLCYILVATLLTAASASAQSNCVLVINCPSNIVVTSCFNVQEFYNPTASNICCGVNSSVVCTPPSGSIFPVGTTTTVNCVATDCASNTNFCSFTVTVLQGTNCATNYLQVQCPSNIVVTSCTNIQEFYAPTVTDTACSNWTVVFTPPSGSFFAPNSTNLVDCFVTDYCGESNDCSFTVTVLQGTNCPTNCLQVQCATNMTVPCGSTVAFDRPVASTCCTNNVPGTKTNLLITVTGTMTNGVCPRYITRTWFIEDGCGDTDTCSQTITVVDTTPPVITCLTNAIIVPLNTNCDLVIPQIQFTATDNCTPASMLVYSQTPPAGTIVSATSYYVTVTVSDLCSNSSSCQVLVEGVPRTPPVVTCPATMVVTNCLVPCVPVTATDYCCPQNLLTITQSPPCNTNLGPGVNSITVTVTDCHGNTTTAVVQLIIAGGESFLGRLYNTGNGNSSSNIPALLTDDTVDPHYTLPASAVPVGMPADYFGNAVAVSDKCHSSGGGGCAASNHACVEYEPWTLAPDPVFTPSAVSKWIAPDYTNNGCCPRGNFIYTMTFSLTGFDATTATISGRWAADDEALMYLNGQITPVAYAPTFATWSSFTIPPGNFLPGLNTLTFNVANFEAWTGLRVEFTNAYAGCSTCTPPVINWITPGLSVQAGGNATFNVSAGGTPPLSYQWSHNNVSLVGDTNSTLQLHSVGYGAAGLYSVTVSNPCGVVTGYVRLAVTQPWGWQWGWWNVQVLTNPLMATVGPALNVVGTSFATNYSITAGTTEDFGLPDQGGQIVNVMEVNPQAAASIQLPLIAAPGSFTDNSYSVVMDLYEPDTSLGTPSTVFQSIACCVSNLSSGGQDGVALTIDASNNLHLAGSAAGTPFDTGPAANLAVDTWNRVAFVVDDPQDGLAVNLGLYLNGQQVGSLTVPTSVGLPINWSYSPPTVLSVLTDSDSINGAFYVSSIQFHDIALSSGMIAGIGSPANGPAPGNVTSAGTQPLLSGALSGGVINISWSGGPYVLQETTNLGSGQWVDSSLPFTETTGPTGSVATSATVNPAPTAPSKFYRLVFRP